MSNFLYMDNYDIKIDLRTTLGLVGIMEFSSSVANATSGSMKITDS